MKLGIGALVALGLMVLLLPLGLAVWLSFAPGELLELPIGHWSWRWYGEFFADDRWVGSLRHSLVMAAFSGLIATGAGLGVIVALDRLMPAHRTWIWAALLSPLVLPPVVVAMALLPVVRQTVLAEGPIPLILAHGVLGLPVAVIFLADGAGRIDPALLLAARGLGAGPVRVLCRVWLPLMRPAILAGFVGVFILSANEVILALFLAPPGYETLPKVIWPNLRYTLTPLVAAASAVSVLVTLGGVAAMLAARRVSRAEQDHRSPTH